MRMVIGELERVMIEVKGAHLSGRSPPTKSEFDSPGGKPVKGLEKNKYLLYILDTI